ncbi:SEC14-like protein 2 [Stegodyphus dumicola]|uniref:SEC14-like protein 2 n=1 Tax=Stegodyphus dumicola TaxID=202533 RepID=UPI0015A7DC4D|nr:SEC14-like protein 2 [Stegodyphus dumicola]
MATSDHKLNNMEQEMLKQFRNALDDVLTPEHTDAVLLKWLRARNFNLKKAEELFRQNLWGRAVYNVKSLLSTYKKHEIAEKFEFASYLGAAKDGTPLRYVALGRGDFYGFIMSMSTADIIYYATYLLEYDIQKTKEQTKKTGKEINEITYIFDMEHFSLHQCTYTCVVETGLDLMRMLQDYYPEIWKNVLVVNAPFYFYQAFNILRPILRYNLLQNIRVVSKENTPELLLKYVDPEVLPAFLGGQRVDSKGDPMCSEFIKFGGIVPVEYYIYNKPYLQKRNPNSETILIPPRSFYNYPIIVREANSILRIEFDTKGGSVPITLIFRPFGKDPEDLDIPLRDEYLDTNNEKHNVFLISPTIRPQTHLVPINYHNYAPWPGIYIFKFDNSRSLLTSIKLDLYIQVEPPHS